MGRQEKKASRDRERVSTLGEIGAYLPYIGFGIAVFMVCSVLYTIVSTKTKVGDLRYVELTAQSEVKEILFSGNPYVVICAYKNGNAFRETERKAQEELRGEILWVSMDCDRKLPSGKTIPEKMKLSKELPQAFVSTGDRYWQFSKDSSSNSETLVEYIRHSMKPRAIDVKTAADFKKKCTDAPACVIVGYHHKLNTSIRDAVLEQHAKARQVRVVAINAQKSQVRLDDVFLASRPRGRSEHWVTVFGIATSASNVVHGSFVKDVLSSAELAALFSTLKGKPASLDRLAKVPALSARERKLGKRVDRESQEESADSSQPSEAAGKDDGDDEEEDDFVASSSESSREEL